MENINNNTEKQEKIKSILKIVNMQLEEGKGQLLKFG